jgi:tetratricopeptide (TPR) repeat protein
MQSSSLTFCERSVEIQTLIERWRLASNIKNPAPQVVVIKGEPGFGKTRLALEFYRWLSKMVDNAGRNPYWPEAASLIQNNLEPNPDPRECQFGEPIPYLWWGLRAADGVGGDAIATYDRFLCPHLVALLVRANMEHRALSIAKAWASVGIDFASSALHVDTILSIGQAAFETARTLTGAIGQRARDREHALKRSISRADAVLLDLAKIFQPKTVTYARTPGVIFLDDAQFLHTDAALPSFVEGLMYKAVSERWPLMILVTHLRTEFSTELMFQENCFVGILRHGRHRKPSEPGPAAGLPGGYLGEESYAEIDLGPVKDLSQALHDKLPGLPVSQCNELLKTIGGNPRFLEQVIQFLFENENFFEEFHQSNPLSIEGLQETLKEISSQEVFRVVLRRLQKAPMEVQEAICLASLQGVRFANDLVDAVAQAEIGRSIRDPLRKAEEPFSMVAGIGNQPEGKIGHFVDRLFQQVAERRRHALESLGGEATLQRTFRVTILSQVNDPAFAKSHSVDTQLMVYGITANLFERSQDYQERRTAQSALAELARLELSRASLESAAAAYERLLAIPQAVESMDEWFQDMGNRIRSWEALGRIYRRLRWPSKQTRALREMLKVASTFIGDDGKVFIFSTDQSTVRENFRRWIEENPSRQSDDYLAGVLVIVRAMLGLSELARAWPKLVFDEGDEPVRHHPFIIKVVEVEGDQEIDDTQLQSEFLSERAYILGAILPDHTVEREHFELLDEIAMDARQNGNFVATEDPLQRALQIAEKIGDDLNQVQALNNLGMVAGQTRRSEDSEKYLGRAKDIIEKLLSGGSFRVALKNEDDGGNEFEKRQIMGTLDIPSRFSEEFDREPYAVVRKVRSLKRLAANVYGNLALLAGVRDMHEETRSLLQRALALHKEIDDLEDVATDLRNLASFSAADGDGAAACTYWSECISVYEELERRHAGGPLEHIWHQSIGQLHDLIRDAGGEPIIRQH